MISRAYVLWPHAVARARGMPQDMQIQPYYRPLRENDFYSDKMSARPIVDGTVARGQFDADTYFYTGKIGSNDGDICRFRCLPKFWLAGRTASISIVRPAIRSGGRR